MHFYESTILPHNNSIANVSQTYLDKHKVNEMLMSIQNQAKLIGNINTTTDNL